MKAILTDVTRCTGCHKCVDACVKEHNLSPWQPHRWTSPDGLSAERFTSVIRHGESHVRKQCRHCLEPACASACPVAALHQTEEGPVVYDAGKCLGCRYCMMACPFGIPRYDWGSAAPLVRKCSMCYETRLKLGKEPACTSACPEQATLFGDRDTLLAEAKRRLEAEPTRYVQQVFGEHEVGGTSVLYLAPVDLSFLQLGRRLDDRPLPDRTVLAMSAVPPTFVGVGALMGGLRWIIGRRIKLAKEQQGATAGHGADTQPPSSTREG